MARQLDLKAALAVLLVGTLWGLNWPTVKFLLTEIPPVSIRAIAFPLAAIVLAIVARTMGQSLKLQRNEWLPALITGAFLIFGFNVLTSVGQTLEETARATIIAYTMPALTAVLAFVVLKESLGLRRWTAVIIGMGGLVVLLSEDFEALMSAPQGAVVMFFAALSWAAGNIALKAFDWRTPPVTLNVWFFAGASVLCWPLVLVFEPPTEQDWPSFNVLLALGFHVAGPMVTCYLLWTRLIQRLPASVAAVSVLIAPIVGVGSSIVLLNNLFTWQKAVALGMVIVCIAMTVSAPASSPRAKADNS